MDRKPFLPPVCAYFKTPSDRHPQPNGHHSVLVEFGRRLGVGLGAVRKGALGADGIFMEAGQAFTSPALRACPSWCLVILRGAPGKQGKCLRSHSRTSLRG